MNLSKNIIWSRMNPAHIAISLAMAFVLLINGHESVMAKSNIKNLSVKPVKFSSLPGWRRDDHALAFITFMKSCPKMRRGRDALARACRKAKKLPKKPSRAQARTFFESYFVPHKVHSRRRGLLTGYYEPEMRGSRVRTKKYNVPLLRRPKDLVVINSSRMRRAARRAGLSRKLTYAKKTKKGLQAYMTREQIEEGGLNGRGLELLWFADPVDVFFLHIQGSGRIALTDGSRVRVGFDGKNGYDYSSVGRALVRSGVIPKGKVTLDNVKAWLRNNPKQGRRAMWHNKSFIFFRELPNLPDMSGPIGAQGVSLVGGRSLAVDRRHYRLGLPIFLSLPRFRRGGLQNFRRLMVAQDTGTAIKGARRGDIFWGSGDKAGDIAGGTYHRGDFFVFLPRAKPLAMKLRFAAKDPVAMARPRAPARKAASIGVPNVAKFLPAKAKPAPKPVAVATRKFDKKPRIMHETKMVKTISITLSPQPTPFDEGFNSSGGHTFSPFQSKSP